MSVIGSNILAGASGQGGGYNLTNSLRFRSSASAYLNRTPATATNRKTWTWSGWVKRGLLGSSVNTILFGATNGAASDYFGFFADNFIFNFANNASGTLPSAALFRDPSAWYHLVVAVDTTQATNTNRVKVYINGSQITFSSPVYPAQNYDTGMNDAVAQTLGRFSYAGIYFYDGYMAETIMVDGQQLTPSSFGETSATTGVWQPIKYVGTYGTNGFYLPFTDNSALTTSSNVGLGKDFSGNGNYFTTNNISITAGSTYDSMTDVPTLTSATASNFAVMNPLAVGANSSQITYSSGNLNTAWSSASNYAVSIGTIGVSSGKWYWEIVNTSTANSMIGVLKEGGSLANYVGQSSVGFSWYSAGSKYNNGAGSAYASAYAQNDVIGIALDMDAGTLTFYKNGTSQGQAFSGLSGIYFPAFSDGDTDAAVSFVSNFGQRPFTYTPPTGFVALNTFNLPTPTIGATASTQANKYMDATLYTGNGSTQSITNAGGFAPGLVWVKQRSGTGWNIWTDIVRGANKQLYSNSTLAEGSDTALITALNSNGFSLGYNGGTDVNASGATYVGWQWGASGTGVTNTAGSITSTVSANTSAGFSVVTYTGTGANATVGHGLGVAPSMMIIKRRSSTAIWLVYHKSYGATNVIFLNSTSTGGANPVFQDTAPSSSVFYINNDVDINASGSTYVAYCFSAIAGYSAMGSYTGNGSTSNDGPFVFTGFKPRFIIGKRTDSTGGWWIFDTARSTFNLADDYFYANLSDAEFLDITTLNIDILSNGFKVRSGSSPSGFINANGGTYIYYAVAENPFKFSLAR